MDRASDFGSEDCGFESRHGQRNKASFFFLLSIVLAYNIIYNTCICKLVLSIGAWPVANYRFLCRHEDDAEYCGQSVMKTNRGNSCCFSYEILHFFLLPPSSLLPHNLKSQPSWRRLFRTRICLGLSAFLLVFAQVYLQLSVWVWVAQCVCVCVFLLSPAMWHAHTLTHTSM